MSNNKKNKTSGKQNFSTATKQKSPDNNALPQQRKTFIIILLLYSIALYINTIPLGFAFDDAVAITGNKFTSEGIKRIPDLLTKDFFAGIYDKGLELSGGRYRPLSLITFAIEQDLFKGNPHISHAINVLLYALTAFILLLTLEEMFPGKFLLCAVTTLLFIAHPVHTEVVANIKSRDEILMFLGLCFTLLYIMRWVRTKKKKYLVWSLVAYFLSLLSKENGITFVAVIPLTLYCFAEQDFKKSLASTIPFFIAGFIYVAMRAALVGIIGDRENNDIMENPFTGISFAERMATITVILGKYLSLLFFPHPLSCDYSYNQIPIVNWGNFKAIFSFLIYAALTTYSIIQAKKKNIAAYGILFYLITMSIVSNIVFNIGAPMGERFVYLPSLGFCLALSFLFLKWLKMENINTLRFSANIFIPVTLVLTGFTYKTIDRNKDWKDNITLFGTDVKAAPNSAKITYYYANALLNDALNDKTNPERVKWLNKALPQAQRATAINPKFHHAHYCLGQIYQELGQADSAIASFNRVLKLQPTHILTQSALGTVYGKMKGDFDKAIYYLEIAVKYNPQDGGAYENLGIAYAMKGTFDKSLEIFSQALKLKPESAQSYMNVAITYQNMKDSINANKYFEKAFQLDPSLRKGNNK